MTMQDLVDAVRFQSLDGGYASRIGTGILTAGVPAALGIGVQTFEKGKWQESFEKKESLALKNYGMRWDDLSRDAQSVIRTNHPELEDMERESKFERREEGGVLDLRRMQKEQTDAANKIKGKLEPAFQEELDRLRIIIPGLGRRLGKWSLNDENYDYYQQLTSFVLNKNMKKEMARRSWQDYDDDQKVDRLESAISNAKKTARVQVEKKAENAMPAR